MADEDLTIKGPSGQKISLAFIQIASFLTVLHKKNAYKKDSTNIQLFLDGSEIRKL